LSYYYAFFEALCNYTIRKIKKQEFFCF